MECRNWKPEGWTLRFTKMNGAGNDFIVLDTIAEPLPWADAAQLAVRLCDRRRGIGADGLMILAKPQGDADLAMRFYNSDGSLGEMCGNGARCVCRYACERGYAGDTVRVETTAGLVTGWRQSRTEFRIRLNDPSVLDVEKLLEVDGKTYRCGYVVLGNPGIPHLTVEYPQLADCDENALRALGRKLRYHPALPKGANVNFYEMVGTDTVLEKTYERGVEDFTLACGTGTGSVAAVLTQSGRVSGKAVRVETAGGTLRMDVTMENGRACGLLLTGPTVVACTGEIGQELLEF